MSNSVSGEGEGRRLVQLKISNLSADKMEESNSEDVFVFPLSFAQQRLWFLDKLDPGIPLYNIPVAFRICGLLNRKALERSFNEIVRRHEILRTTFSTLDDQFVQVVSPSLSVTTSIVDLRCTPDDSRENTLQQMLSQKVTHPFDLKTGPLFRAALFQLKDDEHVLLIIMHHIVSDGWSLGLIFHELERLYESYSTGKELSLPELPIQYSDYAVWQRQWLQGPILDQQLSYWKKQLSGTLPAFGIITDRPRPAVQTFNGSTYGFGLSSELSENLGMLSRKSAVTPFMTLMAAFNVLLYRYTQQEDLLVGIPIAGRRRSELEKLIGFFVNTLVLRIGTSGSSTFRQLLSSVRVKALEAYAHQDIPIEKLVEELKPERSLSHTPFFQVMFNFQNTPSTPLAFPGLTVTPIEVDSGTAKFDLSLYITERAEGLKGLWTYNTDLFDRVTIERMSRHYERILESIVQNPDMRISEIELLGERERHQLLEEWNKTERDYPRQSTVHELFEEQAEKNSGSVAVVLDEQQLSYGELNSRSNQLAHYLRKAGVGPGVPVGIFMDRSLEMVVGMLGTLKTGGTYVPLDPVYPKQRLKFLIQDTKTPIVLTLKTLLDSLPPSKAKLVCIDTDWKTIAREATTNVSNEATSESIAYVMYTSGSTGKPKGVEIPHRGIIRLLLGANYVTLDAKQSILQMASVSFDASTFEIWGALLHGGRCILFPQRIPTIEGIRTAIEKHKISTLWLTSSLFNLVVDEAPEILAGVTQLLIGGESLSVAHVKRALKALPSTQITNGYGPTESTTFACCFEIPRELDRSIESIPIGRSISNTTVFLLDKNFNAVPVGVPGELCIGGDGLAQGYLNQPEITAEKFVPHPFGLKAGTRLYKTGDVARYLPNGTIEFLGRLDHQMKLRGFRIEPGEIESALRQYQGVNEAAVILREDVPGDKRLVAYVTPTEGVTVKPAEMRNYLKGQVADYMVPSTIVVLDSMPLTANGKIDPKRLPLPDQSDSASERNYIPPSTDVERTLAEMWCQLLQLNRVGIHDNFFELGGHSLLATRLMSRIRSVFNIEMTLKSLFELTTIALLAERIEKGKTNSVKQETSAIIPVSRNPRTLKSSI